MHPVASFHRGAAAIVAIAAASTFLWGCSTAPTGERADSRIVSSDGDVRLVTQGSLREQVFQSAPSTVWQSLQRTYREMEIPITGVREDLHRLETMNLEVNRIDGDRMSVFLNCGTGMSGPRVNNHEVVIVVASTVLPEDGGGSRLRTTFDAWARPRTTSGNPVHCSSTNVLEKRIIANVALQLGESVSVSQR